MKSRVNWKWSVGLALMVLPIAAGCVQQAASSPQSTVSATASATPASAGGADLADTNAVPGTNAAAVAEAPEIDLETAPARPLTQEKPLPENLRPSGQVQEVIKLANSGVTEAIMLTFVTNSTSAFGLGAEEIIYLKDIGVPDSVVTAMIQKDQQLREAGIAAAVPPLSSNPTSNWISSTPRPEEVAPQSTAPPPAESPQPAPEQPANVTYNTFYQTLSPYGTWMEIDGYGRVWRPTVVSVNANWSPYYDGGRWIYTDDGWYWLSDYSWGWAPFHYGRWFRHHRHGWCWTPGYVWGPAWVSWRYTSDYCGWAPLPPAAWYTPGFGLTYYGSAITVGFDFGIGWGCYSWVNYGHLHNHHYHHHHRLPHDHAARVYNTSVVATRIESNRNRIVNHGISPDRVRSATGTEVRRVAIREEAGPANRGVRAERLEPNGRTLTVRRPDVRPVSTTASSSLADSGTSGVRNPRTVRSGGSGASGGEAAVSPRADTFGRAPSNLARAERSGTRSGGSGRGSAIDATPSSGTAPGASAPETPRTVTRTEREPRSGSVAPVTRAPERREEPSVRPPTVSQPVRPESDVSSGQRAPRDPGNRPAERPSSGRRSTDRGATPPPTDGTVVARNPGSAPSAPSAGPAPSAPTAGASTPSWALNRANDGSRAGTAGRPSTRTETRQAQVNEGVARTAPAPEVPRYAPSTPNRAYAPAPSRPATPVPSAPSPGYSSRSQPTRSTAPAYVPQTRPYNPAPTYNSTPSYTPPATRSAPAPSYTPPATRSAPSPSYTPPARSYSAPAAPSYSPPARSAPSAPSYSPPARSAPSYAPAPSAPSRSAPSGGGGSAPRNPGGGNGRNSR